MKRLILSSLISLMTTFSAFADKYNTLEECLTGLMNDKAFVEALNVGQYAQNNKYVNTFQGTFEYSGISNYLAESSSSELHDCTTSTAALSAQQKHIARNSGFARYFAYSTLIYVIENCPTFLSTMIDPLTKESTTVTTYMGIPTMCDPDTKQVKIITLDDYETKKAESDLLTTALYMNASDLTGLIKGYFMYLMDDTKHANGTWVKRDDITGSKWPSGCEQEWGMFSKGNPLSTAIGQIETNGKRPELNIKPDAIFFIDQIPSRSDILAFPGLLLYDKLDSSIEGIQFSNSLNSATDFAASIASKLQNENCQGQMYIHVVTPYDFNNDLANFATTLENAGMNEDSWLTTAAVHAAETSVAAGVLWGIGKFAKGGKFATNFPKVVKGLGVVSIVLVAVGAAAEISEMIYATWADKDIIELDKVFVLASYAINNNTDRQLYSTTTQLPDIEGIINNRAVVQNPNDSLAGNGNNNEYTNRDDYSAPAQQPAEKKRRAYGVKF